MDRSKLIEKYGHFDIKTEPKHEERLSDHCSRPDGEGGWKDTRGVRPDWIVPCPDDVTEHSDGRASLKTFVKRYTKEDIYSITQLPDGGPCANKIYSTLLPCDSTEARLAPRQCAVAGC